MTQAATNRNIQRGPMFGVMLVGAFVAFLNQTLINIALPQIMDHFRISAATADWLTTIFMLVNGIIIPVTAYLMERFTTRQLYLTSIALFTIGTIICAIAPNFSVILVGRVVQAAGAGILFPMITNVIFTLYPPEERGAAMGMFGVAINFAPAVGPTLSGWIVQTYSWRILFFVIFPIALLNFFVGFFLIKNVSKTSRPKLDVLGLILSTIGFGGVLYGFAEAGSSGWGSKEVITTFIIGGICLLLFLWRQFVVAHPILEFKIFRYPMFSLTTVINVIVTMALYSGMILMPIYMQNVRGFTPLLSGLMLLPGGIIMGIMSPITGRIFDKIGAKLLSISGLAITVITTYALSRLQMDTTFTYITIIYTARMLGMSLLMMPIFTAGLNDLPLSLNRYGTAMVNTLRMMSGAMGMALFVSIMTQVGTAYVKNTVKQQNVLMNQAQMGAIANEGMIHGINDAFLVANILTVISLVLSFFIRKTIAGVETVPNKGQSTIQIQPSHQSVNRKQAIIQPVVQTGQRRISAADQTFRNALRHFHKISQTDEGMGEENPDAVYRSAIRRFLQNAESSQSTKKKASNQVQIRDIEFRQALRSLKKLKSPNK